MLTSGLAAYLHFLEYLVRLRISPTPHCAFHLNDTVWRANHATCQSIGIDEHVPEHPFVIWWCHLISISSSSKSKHSITFNATTSRMNNNRFERSPTSPAPQSLSSVNSPSHVHQDPPTPNLSHAHSSMPIRLENWRGRARLYMIYLGVDLLLWALSIMRND